MWKLQPPPPPPEKSHPPLSQQPPSKSWGPAKLLFLKIWLEAQHPPAEMGGGGCPLCLRHLNQNKYVCFLYWKVGYIFSVFSYCVRWFFALYHNSTTFSTCSSWYFFNVGPVTLTRSSEFRELLDRLACVFVLI